MSSFGHKPAVIQSDQNALTASAPARFEQFVTPQLDLPARYDVLGVQISATDYDEIVTVLMQFAKAGRSAIVDFTPADLVVRATQDPSFGRILEDFDVLCPDGQPVRWLLNCRHHLKLRDRVCGTTTMLRLCAAAAHNGVGVYLYGSTPATICKLRKRLLGYYPALQIVGMESPPFRPLSAAEDADVVDRVNASGAGLVFVGLGSPKQERFAWEHRGTVKGVQLCVGAAFDFIAGTKRRAPLAVQRIGLEWLFRLCCEPRRLARRYIVGNAQFTLAAVRQLCSPEERRQS
jgi:N-acetylglucosaminyldiphosphoundecaprenol N-acetyl-beta-D-mannosaminyltransferase